LSAPTVDFVRVIEDPTVAASSTTDPANAATVAPGAGGVALDATPATVGGFTLLLRLGGGGMGSVFEAEDPASGRHVAVKLVLPQYAGAPDALLRFRQEGKLASSLAHPRCVFVLAADEEAGRPYIVMELMPGSTLDDLVRTKGPLPPEEAIVKILDVIDGLREAHRLGLVHRDVKPSNCFLEADGRVKVGDFGLARSLMDDSKLTKTGTFIGTPLFASPEQIKMEAVDAQSDLYSVAATLYFLLTGRPPFQAGDMMATMARIVSDDVPPMRSLRPELSKALDKTVLRGLERDRKRRYKDLGEFRQALLGFLPARPSAVGTGLRFLAYILDSVLLAAIGLIVGVVITLGTRLASGQAADLSDPKAWSYQGPANPAGWLIQACAGVALTVGYYGLLEGWLGWSLGKRLLRLRVGASVMHRPPGVPRAMLRAAVLVALMNFGGYVLMIVWIVADLPAEGSPRNPREALLITALGLGNTLWTLVALGLIVCTMRPHNGYRGLHEFLSGTRTYRLHWPRTAKRRTLKARPFEWKVSKPDGMPAQVGAFHVLGAITWSGRGGILLAEDPRLGRQLWVWLRPATDPSLDAAERDISRATRNRWVACGIQEDWQWDAFLAPNGAPLSALAADGARLTWADVRPILEDVTEELTASCKERALPRNLTVDQIWIVPDGPTQLLGLPMEDVASSGEKPPHASDAERALSFLRHVAIVALEGNARLDGAWSGPVRAPVPVHATEMLERLYAENDAKDVLERWQKDLDETRDRPTEVTRLRRAAHLGLVAALLHIPFVGPTMLLIVTFVLLYTRMRDVERNDSFGAILVGFAVVGVLVSPWILWAFAFRGGYAFWRGGIHLRRADGRPTARWQCGLRAFVVWMPVLCVFSAAIASALFVPQLPELYFTLWTIGALLFPLWFVLALWNPTRGLHDRLAGTYLVPD
jgi:hypothetical protein